MLTFISLGGPESMFLLSILILFFYIAVNVITVLPIWKIFQKSGQNPWLSLLVLIPGVGMLIALYVAAFSEWRIDKQ